MEADECDELTEGDWLNPSKPESGAIGGVGGSTTLGCLTLACPWVTTCGCVLAAACVTLLICS